MLQQRDILYKKGKPRLSTLYIKLCFIYKVNNAIGVVSNLSY